MKKLKELGISPAPWSKSEAVLSDDIISEIVDANGVSIAQTLMTDYKTVRANNDFIAAAPLMYDALREAVVEKCTECHQINDYESDIGVEWQLCKGCPIKKWRDALAKASGESEVKK